MTDVLERWEAASAHVAAVERERNGWVKRLYDLQLEADVAQGRSKTIANAAVREVQSKLGEFAVRLREAKAEMQRLDIEVCAYRQRLKTEPAKVPAAEPLAEGLVELLGKWRGYSQDRSRIASFRCVANEVADDIESLLKRTVTP